MNTLATAAPDVSAVIPARDAETTLGEALDSLLAQTVPYWEAIVVDDGSADGTAQVALAYAARDPRVRLLRTRAVGAAAARNVGLATARGRRLLFLDADDWIAPTHLEHLLRVLATTPEAVASYCAFRRVGTDGSIGPAIWRSEIASAPAQAFSRPGTAINAVLVDRAAVATAGGFDPALRTCEDWDLWQRLARGGARFVGTPEPLAFYRMRLDSLSHAHSQLLRDGMTVLRRGFLSLGGFETELRYLATYIALWCAAAKVGTGRDGIGLMENSGLAILLNDDIDAMCDTLFDGLAVGAGVATAPSLASGWEAIAPALDGLLRWLELAVARPGLAHRLTHALELRVLAACDLAAPVRLGQTMGARVDVRRLTPLMPPPGVDRALLRLCHGPEVVLRSLELPLLGPLAAREVAALAVEELGVGPVWRRSGLAWHPTVWGRAARAAALLALRAVARRRAPARFPAAVGGLRGLAKAAVASAMIDAAGPSPGPSSNSRVLAEICRRATEEATRIPRPSAATPVPRPRGGREVPWTGDRRLFWEAIFETPDPWDYTSDYEAVKYQRTLDLLPQEPIGEALELACAEGHFTRLLAPRVGHLTAIDISNRALARAGARCAAHANLAFRRLDLSADPLPGRFDLVVCSEVLYYLADEAALRAVAEKLRDALATGGHLVMAHAFVLTDDLGRTGFDWGHPFGAATIARVFAATPGLVAERSIASALYRIDRFRRGDAGRGWPALAEEVPLSAAVPPEVARQVVWGGAEAVRCDLQRREATDCVPVLMYHRIAEEGSADLVRYRVPPSQFQAQLRLLRRRGYHPLSSAELRWFIGARHPMAGRPVLITFDDAYRDFLDAAWPILRANDFTAEVFVPTDAVGGVAEWDAAHGRPAPLLGWEEIAALAREGVSFGSHLAHHVDGYALSTAGLAAELARSRAALEARLGQEVRAFAAPYGALDERIARLAAGCGYHIGFSTRTAWARLGDPPLMLPRIEVRGEWDLDTFAEVMKNPR